MTARSRTTNREVAPQPETPSILIEMWDIERPTDYPKNARKWSKRAIQVNIEIMRAFVRLRRMLASNAGLARKLNELERKYDSQFRVVFDAIRELMTPPPEPGPPPRRKIGFTAQEKSGRYSIGRKKR